MSRLRLILGNWYRKLHTRKMHAAIGKKSTVEQRQIWHIVDSWIQNKEQPIPRSQAWSIIASNNVSQSTWQVEKSHISKEWSVPNYCWKMVKGRKVSRGFVWTSTDRGTNQTIRRTCTGRPLLWSYTYRKATMATELAHCSQQRTKTRSDKATPWFSWSEALVSSTIQRTCGKYPLKN